MAEEFEAETPDETWELRLYVAGQTPKSVTARHVQAQLPGFVGGFCFEFFSH